MTVTSEQFGLDRLPQEQRLDLLELLWDSLERVSRRSYRRVGVSKKSNAARRPRIRMRASFGTISRTSG